MITVVKRSEMYTIGIDPLNSKLDLVRSSL